MLKINKKVEYCLIALRYLQDNNNNPVSTKLICDNYNISFDVLSQSLQCLTRDGILISQKGARGGYQLGHDLVDISLLRLWECLEGEQSIVECLTQNNHCAIADNCSVMLPMKKLNEQLRNFLDNIKVSKLLNE